MQTIIVISIVVAAGSYLVWRFVKHGSAGGCGCLSSCSSKDTCTSQEGGKGCKGNIEQGKIY